MNLRTREIVHPVFGIPKTIIEPESFLPSTPGGWRKIDAVADGGAYVHETHSGQVLAVIVSACIEDDGVPWVHVSVSKRTSKSGSAKRVLPTWGELKFVKNSFVGRDRDCVQVLPREEEYVNISEVLHLFYRLDGERPCPDFTSGTGSI